MSDTKPITTEDLERLDALEEAATPGPWIWEPDHLQGELGFDGPLSVQLAHGRLWIDGDGQPGLHDDREAIVALRNTYPALRARIAELEVEMAHPALEAMLDRRNTTVFQQDQRIKALRAECAGLMEEGKRQAQRIAELERECVKLRRQVKDSEDELKEFQRSGGNYWGDMIGEDA